MATSDSVPGLFDVAINGVPFRARSQDHRRRYHEIIKQQADTSNQPSEASLNPEDLWRRGQGDFKLGSGQEHLDGDDDAVHNRFNSSVGVDPWTERQLTLLKDTEAISSFQSPFVSGSMVVVDGGLFVVRNTRVSFYDGSTWTDATALSNPIHSIATDGTNVYLASRNTGKTAGGIYVINTDTDSAPHTPVKINDLIPDTVAYVNGRLMASAGYSLYNITDVGVTTVPSALTAAAINSQWEWTCWSQAPDYIYVAGNANDLSMIYRITIREDGTALTAPVVAGTLPDGELVQSMTFYLGLLIVATSRGVRLALPSGGLSLGSLIEIGSTHSLEPQGRFVWCGGDDGNLTRLDLSRFIPGVDLVPARADDLVSGVSGNVLGVNTIADRRYFCVNGGQVYREHATTYESTGTYRSGRITYGLIDPKQFVYLDVRADTLAASETVTVKIKIEDGSDTTLGTLDSSDSEKSFRISDTISDPVGEYAEVVLILNGDGTSTPVVTRWVLRAEPVVRRTEEIQVVLDLYESIVTYAETEHYHDVWSAYEGLQALCESGTVVDYQELDRSYKASVRNVQLGPGLKVSGDRLTWEGPCVVTMKVYP